MSDNLTEAPIVKNSKEGKKERITYGLIYGYHFELIIYYGDYYVRSLGPFCLQNAKFFVNVPPVVAFSFLVTKDTKDKSSKSKLCILWRITFSS